MTEEPPQESGYLDPLWHIPGAFYEDPVQNPDLRAKQQAVYDCLLEGGFTQVSKDRETPDCLARRSSNTTTLRVRVDSNGKIKNIDRYPTWFAWGVIIACLFFGIAFQVCLGPLLLFLIYMGIKFGRRQDEIRREVLRCMKALTPSEMR